MIVIYFLSVISSPLFSFVFPSNWSTYNSLFREGILFFFCVASVVIFFLRKKDFFKIYRSQMIILVYLGFVIVYSYLTQVKDRFLECFLLYTSGPIVFLTYTMLYGRKTRSKKDLDWINFLLLSYVFLSLLLYYFQPYLLVLSRIEDNTIYRHLYRDDTIRFFGLTFMPTTMAFLCILILFFSRKLGKILGIIGLFLTGTRLFFPGVVLGWFNSLSKKKKYCFLPIVAIFFLCGFMYFSLSRDISLRIHFNHLFIDGPKIVLENLYGVGLGNIAVFNPESNIAIESDIYLYFVQFGVVGGLSYLSIFCSLFSIYMRTPKNRFVYIAQFLLIVYFIGSLFLPLTLQRVMSNTFWLYQAILYSLGVIYEK